MPASSGVLSPLPLLHFLQAATQFFHVVDPPREAGKMWSTVIKA
jgi:hypothetical protein